CIILLVRFHTVSFLELGFSIMVIGSTPPVFWLVSNQLSLNKTWVATSSFAFSNPYSLRIRNKDIGTQKRTIKDATTFMQLRIILAKYDGIFKEMAIGLIPNRLMMISLLVI